MTRFKDNHANRAKVCSAIRFLLIVRKVGLVPIDKHGMLHEISAGAIDARTVANSNLNAVLSLVCLPHESQNSSDPIGLRLVI